MRQLGQTYQVLSTSAKLDFIDQNGHAACFDGLLAIENQGNHQSKSVYGNYLADEVAGAKVYVLIAKHVSRSRQVFKRGAGVHTERAHLAVNKARRLFAMGHVNGCGDLVQRWKKHLIPGLSVH